MTERADDYERWLDEGPMALLTAAGGPTSKVRTAMLKALERWESPPDGVDKGQVLATIKRAYAAQIAEQERKAAPARPTVVQDEAATGE